MNKKKENKKTINEQKETEQRQSMIKRKQNTTIINDQKETEQKDYQ
jgi:hypothetical protein